MTLAGSIANTTYEADVQDAARIPALTHEEAGTLARTELERMVAVVETLEGDDWQQPTECTEWTVRDMVAHQAGSYAGGASWPEFFHQASARPSEDQMQVDAMNARQVADRAGASTEELIAELREVGPKAVRRRSRLPWLLRKIPVPFGPPLGTAKIEYLTDVIYPRDTWMHRADICRATGKSFVQTAEHDGRMVALVVRELADHLRGTLNGASVVFELRGAAGGRYRIGDASEPAATITMDVLNFSRLASERITTDEVQNAGLAEIAGDAHVASHVLANTVVPY